MSSSKKNGKKKKLNKKNNGIFSVISKYYLYFIFIALLLFVVYLSIRVYKASITYKKNNGDIVVSLNDKRRESKIGLDLKELSKKKDYAIKITNYMGDNINKNDYKYNISIITESGTKIEVWKNSDKENSITGKKNIKIENVLLKGNKKQNNIYHIAVLDKKKIKNNEKLYVNILLAD